MYFLLKVGMLHCYVSSPKGRCIFLLACLKMIFLFPRWDSSLGGRCISYWKSLNISMSQCDLVFPEGSFFMIIYRENDDFPWLCLLECHFSLVTHLNYQEKISGPPELTPYFRNGTNKVLSWVLLYMHSFVWSVDFTHVQVYITIYSWLLCLCFASFHPSLHPYSAAQQPRTSLQNK